MTTLHERRLSLAVAGGPSQVVACERPSAAGVVSQRACVFCGARVVLYPISDAVHLVHGPIGCAAYTWDIRGSLSSGPTLHRHSFCTDLREREVIFGGIDRLTCALDHLIAAHQPRGAFVYSTCLAGVIGDDVAGACQAAERRHGIPVIPVEAPGFAGSKKDGYKAACDALMKLIGTAEGPVFAEPSINILGDFNLAGEIWTIRRYFEDLGIRVVATITGDGRIDEIRGAHRAQLNLVQCAGSMNHLARMMEERFKVPSMFVSFVGMEDTASAIYQVVDRLGDQAMKERAQVMVKNAIEKVQPDLMRWRRRLKGRTAAVYTGGAFKAISLVRALRVLGMQTMLVGSQTGSESDYQQLQALCDPGTLVADDLTSHELEEFLDSHPVDLLIGGVKERYVAYKRGIGFCDHNHERKHGLAGFDGMLAFAQEVASTVLSPARLLAARSL